MRAHLVSLLVAGAIAQGALAANPPEVIEGAALREWAKALGPGFAIFLAALVGFAGVIVTQVVNARLARKQVAHEREREARRQREEIKSIALALRAEIRAYEPILTDSAKIVGLIKGNPQRRTQEQFRILAPTAPEIYPKIIDRLGMIDPQLAPKIVKFYRELRIYREGFLMIAESESAIARQDELYFDRTIKWFGDTARMANELCNDLQTFADSLDA